MLQIPSDQALTAVGRSIQLAIAPVFLLSGVAAFLNVLNSRLLRVVDRTRTLEERDAMDELDELEMQMLMRRRHAINYSITLCTVCALCICILIMLMFVGAVVHVDVLHVVVALFVGSMATLIGALLFFLREVNMAVRHFRRTLRHSRR